MKQKPKLKPTEHEINVLLEYDNEHLKEVIERVEPDMLLELENAYVEQNYLRFLDEDTTKSLENKIEEPKQKDQVVVKINSDTDDDTINATVTVNGKTMAYSNEGKKELKGKDLKNRSSQATLAPKGNEMKQVLRESDDIDRQNKVNGQIGLDNKNTVEKNITYGNENTKNAQKIKHAKDQARMEFRSMYQPKIDTPKPKQKKKTRLKF